MTARFDRVYILIANIDPLVVYVHDEGLARFCTEDYKKPTTKNINN